MRFGSPCRNSLFDGFTSLRMMASKLVPLGRTHCNGLASLGTVSEEMVVQVVRRNFDRRFSAGAAEISGRTFTINPATRSGRGPNIGEPFNGAGRRSTNRTRGAL